MASTDLVFYDPPLAGPSYDLVFGATGAPVITPATLTLTAALPGLTMVAQACDTRTLVLTGILPALTLAAEMRYASNTQRPEVGNVRAAWQVGDISDASTQGRMRDAVSALVGTSTSWSTADTADADAQVGYSDTIRTPSQRSVTYADAVKLGTNVLSGRHQDGERTRGPARQLKHQNAVRVGSRAVRLPHQDGIRDRTCANRVLWQEALRHRLAYLRDTEGKAQPLLVGRGGRYQEAMRPPPGIYVAPAIPPAHICYTPSTALVFSTPWSDSLDLVFVCEHATPPTPHATLFILPARFYMTTHTISATRLPDMVDIPIFDATVSADAGSFCWTLSASGPDDLFAMLAPVDGLPARLQVNLDGIPFVFAIDGLSRSAAFGKRGVSISGRSVTALIGAPYMRVSTRSNTELRLAQQLALDALADTGIDLDWGLTDWLVPTGAWSHQGTPLDAVQAIAQAAGGYLQSHRSAATLLTRHPYAQRDGDNPGAPWGWLTGPADVELAPDAIITNAWDRKDGPDINAVYVSGTTQGVLAQVKREGSAGDKLASMVTDALITDVIAARQRGLAILGVAGPQYGVRLELPVLTGVGEPGVLDVGQLVQINEATPWRGRVSAVSVNAKRPSLRQSVTLERHL